MKKSLTLDKINKFCKENGFEKCEITMQMENEIEFYNPDTGECGGIIEHYDEEKHAWIRTFWTSSADGPVKEEPCPKRLGS